jgi:hypothetical protein
MLTLETGVGLANANSFVSLVDVRTYASLRGLTLPEDDDALEILVIRAHDYIRVEEHTFRGGRLQPDQALPFPRLDCYDGDPKVLPVDIKTAVSAVVAESVTNPILAPLATSFTTEETLGPIKEKFTQLREAQRFPLVDALLAPFRKVIGGLSVRRA